MDRRKFLGSLPVMAGMASIKTTIKTTKIEDPDGAVGIVVLELSIYGRHGKLSDRAVPCRFKLAADITASGAGAYLANADSVDIVWGGDSIEIDSFSLGDKNGNVLFVGSLQEKKSLYYGDTLRFLVGNIRVSWELN